MADMKRALPLAGMVGVLALAAPARAEPPKLEVQEVAETGSMPKGALLSHDRKRFYVTNFGQLDKKNITVFDARTLAQIDQIDVPGVIVESALSPDDATLYVSNFRRHSVMFIDLATRSVAREITTGAHPKVLVTSPDGRSLFAANWASRSVTQIDTATGRVVRTLDVGKEPRGMAMARSGKLFVANFYGDSIDVFEGKDLDKRHRLSVCKCPRHLAVSPDDRTLYISCLNASQIQAMDIASEAVTHKVAVGDSPKSVDVSRDGRWVYSADYGVSRSVSVVDTHDWTARVFRIPAMDRGSGVAVGPDGEHALVTGWYDGHVYLVGFEGSGGHPDEAKTKMRRWQFRPRHEDPGDGAAEIPR